MQSLRLAAKWLHKTKSSPQGDTSYSYLNSHISDLRSTLKKIDLISISLAIQVSLRDILFYEVVKKLIHRTSIGSAPVGAVSCVCEYTETVTSKAKHR